MKDTRRQTRRPLSAEDKIFIALQGLRGEDSIAAFCCKEGMYNKGALRAVPTAGRNR